MNDLAGKLAGLLRLIFLDPKSPRGWRGRGVTDGSVLIEAVQPLKYFG